MGFSYQYTSIILDGGLAQNRRQAIIKTNVDWVYWGLYVSISPNELTHWPLEDLTEISNK